MLFWLMETKTVMESTNTLMIIQGIQFEARTAMQVNLVDIIVLIHLRGNMSNHLDRYMLPMRRQAISLIFLWERVKQVKRLV